MGPIHLEALLFSRPYYVVQDDKIGIAPGGAERYRTRAG
jgi:hypothetical protein